MKREARKLFNRLNKYNEFANDYPRLYGELENDGGHWYPPLWQYATGKYTTIMWRWNPYAYAGGLILRAKMEARKC